MAFVKIKKGKKNIAKMLTKIFKVILPQCKKLHKNTQIIQLPQCIFHLVEVSKNEKIKIMAKHLIFLFQCRPLDLYFVVGDKSLRSLDARHRKSMESKGTYY